jgi:hypothetical protein
MSMAPRSFAVSIVALRPLAPVLSLLLALTTASCGLRRGEPRDCVVAGRGPSSDFELARKACARVELRFAELFGDRAPTGGILLSRDPGIASEAGYGKWHLRWPVTVRLREAARSLGKTDPSVIDEWETTLPHEIGHVMVAAYFYPNTLPVAEGEYGTPLPDWFDEAVAVWMEPPAMRRERLAQGRAMLTHATLAQILRQRHPYADLADGAYQTRIVLNGPCRRLCGSRARPADTQRIVSRVFRDGRVEAETTYFAGDSLSRDEPEARFYAHSFAILQYVVDRGGRPAVHALSGRLRQHQFDPSVLIGLPGIPADSAALERDWHSWLTGSTMPTATGDGSPPNRPKSRP